MRKAALCFLLISLSVIAFGQQPQWTVVQSVVLVNQGQPIPATNLLTPSEAVPYRLTLYFSGGSRSTRNETIVAAEVNGTDITNTRTGLLAQISCNFPEYSNSQIVSVLKPQASLSYFVKPELPEPSTCPYNLVITVEQLVQQ